MAPNTCTLYSNYADFDKIITQTKSVLPTAIWDFKMKDEFKIAILTIKAGFLQKDKKIKISYRERVNPSYQLTKAECPLTQNLVGMQNMVASIPANDEAIKSQLLQKIQTLNSECSVQMLTKCEKEYDELIKKLVEFLDAIIFAQSQSNFSKSNAQHFLNKELHLILDMHGITAIQNLDVKIDPKYFDVERSSAISDQQERKKVSEKILKEQGIKVNEKLPESISEAEVKLRTHQEIAERIVALALTNLVAFKNISGEQAIAYAKKHNISGFLTEKEIAFLENPTPEKMNHETWKCESIWVLSWALNNVAEIPFPDTLVNLAEIPEESYPIGSKTDPLSFVRSISQLRSKAEILNANDLYYRMNWACVDARVKEEKVEVIHPGITYERHYALNWLINYRDQDWDDVSTNT